MNKKEIIIYGIYLAGFVIAFFHGVVGVIGLFIILINSFVHLIMADNLYNTEKKSKLSIFSYLFAYVYTYNIVTALFLLRGWKYDVMLWADLIITLIALLFPFSLIYKNIFLDNNHTYFYKLKIRAFIFMSFAGLFLEILNFKSA